MGIRSNIAAILELIPHPSDISRQEACKRLELQLDARKLRNLKAFLESLTPKGLKFAAYIGPAGLSMHNEAAREIKAQAACCDENDKNHNETIVHWLARHPDGQKFLETRGI